MIDDDKIAQDLGRTLLRLVREAVRREIAAERAMNLRALPSVARSASSSSGMPLAPKLLYSRKEAASALSISQRSLDRLIARGELKAVRKSSRLLISSHAIEAWSRRDQPRPIRELATREQVAMKASQDGRRGP